MNKTIVSIIAFILAVCQVSAQTLDSLPHHNLGPHSARSGGFMLMSDNTLLDGIMLADEFSQFYPLGYVFHKVSWNGTPPGDNLLEITDTLFLPYENLPWLLMAKDPEGDGNILAELVNDYENNRCFLRIRHFDDNLNIDDSEVVVPIADFLCTSARPGLLLDPNGDIILSYYDYYSSERHFARVGLDGTVKYRTKTDTMEIDSGSDAGPVVFSESPLRYCYWGEYLTPQQQRVLNCYLIDNAFEVTDCYTLPSNSGYPDYVSYSYDSFTTSVLGIDGGRFLVAMPYYRPSSLVPHIEDDGVAVLEYDSNFNLLTRRKFLSDPILEYQHPNARPIGLQRSKDGNIYFAYFTSGGHIYYGHYYGNVSVVKMDEDLNIIWQRYCLEPEGCGRDWGDMVVLEDNSVAVMGINTFTNSYGHVNYSETFYLIVNDDYDGMEEQGFIIRPYAYYPNPVQDELHLQYSPDVKPKQIELYDLQGRLVKTQRNGLESINMEGLASGAYTMRVTLEGGKVFSDKIIKE